MSNEAGDKERDLIIVGGGPAGLSAAVNAVARGLWVTVLDAGGTKLAKAEKIDNYLGLPGLSGREIMERFAGHASGLGVSIEKGKVISILSFGNRYMVSYGSQAGSQVQSAKAVILAAGAMRETALEGEEEYLGKGVSYCATCDGILYRGRKAVVYGLSADAAEEANFLAEIGVKAVYVTPGPRPAGLHADIPWQRGTLQAVRGENTVTGVEFKEPSLQPLEAQGVFLLRDAVAPQAIISGLKTENGYIAADNRMRTNLGGLFACGDCTGGPLQISKAAGEGLIAGQEAAKYIGQLHG